MSSIYVVCIGTDTFTDKKLVKNWNDIHIYLFLILLLKAVLELAHERCVLYRIKYLIIISYPDYVTDYRTFVLKQGFETAQ